MAGDKPVARGRGARLRDSAAREERALTIGALSQATRIPAETLRTWERRYGAPRPTRKPSGHRLYPAAAVDHLRRVSRLLARGHRPGEILPLAVQELDGLLALGESAADPGPAPGERTADRAELASPVLFDATLALDRELLQAELRTQWARLGPLRFLETVAGPFLVEVGRRWQAKDFDVQHEHFASACLADFLREVRGPYDLRARGPRVVAATLPGDRHEGGLLMVCTLLAMRDYRVVYLGPDTPVEKIAAATKVGIEALAVSVSTAVGAESAEALLARLRGLVPRRLPIWVGGAGAPQARSASGIERFASLGAFDSFLKA